MGTPFCVYGPFEFERKRINELDYRNAKWDEIDQKHYFLSEAKGAYLISVRNGGNYKPLYVGITHKVRFKGDVFNKNNLLNIATKLHGSGALTIHLLAKPKKKQKGFSTIISQDVTRWVEIFVLFLGRAKNEYMWNKAHTRFLEDTEIEGVTGSFSTGPTAKNVATFMNALDW
jgi:hypothetical protein